MINTAKKISIGILLPLIVSCTANGQEEFKEFKNDFGYQVSVPQCWKIGNANGPDDSEVHESVDVAFEATAKCNNSRGKKFEESYFSVDVAKKLPTEQKEQTLRSLLKAGRIKSMKKEWYAFQEMKIDSQDAIAYVERYTYKTEPIEIRWKIEVFCPLQSFRITILNYKNPPSEKILKDMEAGDLLIPEREKAILDSFKCLPPKNTKKVLKYHGT